MINQLANVISILRILGVGIIFWLTPYSTNKTLIAVVLIFIVVSVSDFFDGWIARRLKIVSEVGKVLDPLADKILVLLFLPLLEMQVITSFPVFIILAREFIMMGLRIFSVQRGEDTIPAQLSGKIKTLVTLPVCGILLGRVPVELVDLPLAFYPIEWLRVWVFSWPTEFVLALVYGVVAVTIWSFIDYMDSFFWRIYLKRFNNNEQKARLSLRAMVPNFFSILNLMVGILGVYYAFVGHLSCVALMIVICVLLDAIDGSIARRLKVSSSVGARLDTMADCISFGALPAMTIYSFLVGSIGFWAILLAVTYVLATGFRLIRFMSVGHSDFFKGIPSPFAASLVCFSAISVFFSSITVFSGVVFVMMGLMVSSLPYPHRQAASKKRFLRFVQFPILIFTVLSIAMLVRGNTGPNYYVYDILIVVLCAYIMSPFIYREEF